MSYAYEVTVDVHLYDVFRTMATGVLEGMGFHTGLHLARLEGPGVVEYHRNGEVVVFSTTHESHGRRRLVVTSETIDAAQLVASVVERLATALVTSFWAPAARISPEALEQEVGQALKQVRQRATEGGG